MGLGGRRRGFVTLESGSLRAVVSPQGDAIVGAWRGSTPLLRPCAPGRPKSLKCSTRACFCLCPSAIAFHNKAAVYDLLFRTAAETLIMTAVDPKHLGAHIGLNAVLHTWGSALTHHPHVYVIIPCGGRSPDGSTWIACKPGFFLPPCACSRSPA
jgi:Putative transposase